MATYDYSILYRTFSRLIMSQLDMIMIELSGNGEPPKPPYVAFDIISPKLPNNFLEDDPSFECVVSFTVYAKRKLDALNKCNELRDILGDLSSQDIYDKNGIVMVERMQTTQRYVQETNAYAYMYGFDVRLRLREPFKDDRGQITDVEPKRTIKGE